MCFGCRGRLRGRARLGEEEGEMEKEGKCEKERDFVLQWGNRKRLRCVKVKKDHHFNNNNNNRSSSDCLEKKKIITSRIVSSAKDFSPLQQQLNKNLGSLMNHRKQVAVSPEKEDRYYTTRGSLGLDENGRMLGLDHRNGYLGDTRRNNVWPKLFLSLSSKEKEEDFMAMKGCKLPQRPKKRAKFLQKSLLLVMPGSWLSDLCQERYEVREKKASKKRPRGLKAMGSMESDSE